MLSGGSRQMHALAVGTAREDCKEGTNGWTGTRHRGPESHVHRRVAPVVAAVPDTFHGLIAGRATVSLSARLSYGPSWLPWTSRPRTRPPPARRPRTGPLPVRPVPARRRPRWRRSFGYAPGRAPPA